MDHEKEKRYKDYTDRVFKELEEESEYVFEKIAASFKKRVLWIIAFAIDIFTVMDHATRVDADVYTIVVLGIVALSLIGVLIEVAHERKIEKNKQQKQMR